MNDNTYPDHADKQPMKTVQPLPISVFILTKNEEQDLPGCLQAISWSDDIHVFDSLSTDNTARIAEQYGARVTTRPFDNWSAHQNWALANLPFKHEWVLYLDADERVTPELAESFRAAMANPGEYVAFRIRRRDYFQGGWLNHVQTSPYYMRLFRPERMHYERLSHPISIPDGPVGEVSGYLDHYPFSKGMAHWFVKHNGYSTLEAQQIVSNRRANSTFSIKTAFLSKDFHEKRSQQKELFYRLPARPLIKFLILYVLKRGFLDGRPGLTYAFLQSIYEYMIVLKTQELEAAADGEAIPARPYFEVAAPATAGE